MDNDNDIDFTKLRYVLYARKSTEDESRQIKSKEEQIAECEALALRLGLKIVKPYLEESKSAKRPNNRQIFTQMLKDLKSGKYDGILAWHPDRLARNMLEGGQIIDMIDEGLIKDLKFVTHHFTKDANGKMLLGMAFVLSKQYSDKLSQDVIRGVRYHFAEGKSPVPKPGYFRDDDGQYRPDGKKFELIKKAWELRADGTSFGQIVEFLDTNGYERKTKKGRIIKITKQTLTDLFKDPFYYGILKQNNKTVDLREIYNFQPAISEELYTKIQTLSYRKIFTAKKQQTAFYPLKKMITCAYCGSNMYVGPSRGNTKSYLMARCNGQSCKRKGKSIRTNVVFDFICEFLGKGLSLTEADYHNYYGRLSKVTEQKMQKLIFEKHSKQAVLKNIERDLTERSLNIVKLDKNSAAWDINERKINELGRQKADLGNQIEKLEAKIKKPEEDNLTLEDFLNLSKNAGVAVQAANAVVKDQICRLIFSNFTVNEANVLSYQLKEPFYTMIKQRQLSSSRGERT